MKGINTLFTVQTIDDSLDTLKPMLAMAKSMQAHMDVLILGSAPQLPSPVYMETAVVDWNLIYREATDKANHRHDAMEKLAKEMDVSISISIEAPVAAMVPECVGRHALYSDLVLVPHGGSHRLGAHKHIFHSVLFDMALPVLVMGAGNRAITSIQRVLIGWSPVPQAARAVRYSLPFIANAGAVHLALVNTSGEDGTEKSGRKMSNYLERHDLSVTIDHLSEEDEVANILNRHAAEMEADLIIIGGYGHSKLREWMLGGTTRFMLSDTQLPILMAH